MVLGFVRVLCGLTIAAMVLSSSPFAAAYADTQRPLLEAGKKSLYQKVLTHPGAALRNEPGAKRDLSHPVRTFSMLYVYDRKTVDGRKWVQVGASTEVTVQAPFLKSPRPSRERARERVQLAWGAERLPWSLVSVSLGLSLLWAGCESMPSLPESVSSMGNDMLAQVKSYQGRAAAMTPHYYPSCYEDIRYWREGEKRRKNAVTAGAVVGGAAGATAGAIVSDDKAKGAVVGEVAGAVAGALTNYLKVKHEQWTEDWARFSVYAFEAGLDMKCTDRTILAAKSAQQCYRDELAVLRSTMAPERRQLSAEEAGARFEEIYQGLTASEEMLAAFGEQLGKRAKAYKEAFDRDVGELKMAEQEEEQRLVRAKKELKEAKKTIAKLAKSNEELQRKVSQVRKQNLDAVDNVCDDELATDWTSSVCEGRPKSVSTSKRKHV